MNKEQITPELLNLKRENYPKYLLNTRQNGEALELLSELENNGTNLIFFDPQYRILWDWEIGSVLTPNSVS